jgi:signal transduction histidine kinase
MYPEEPVSVRPTSVVREVVDQFMAVCHRRGIRLLFSNEGSSQCALRVGMFKNAVKILVSNGIEAMPSGGTLKVHIRELDEIAMVTIADTGPAVPELIHGDMAHPSTRGGQRNRLGLYQVYWTVMVAHHGNVWFDVNHDHGTTFFLEVPAIEGAVQPRPRAIARPRVIQLRCCLCDHWKHNGGQCPGAGECCDLAFLI